MWCEYNAFQAWPSCSRITDRIDGTRGRPVPLEARWEPDKLTDTWEIYAMRKLIIAATALAFLSSTAAFAQSTDKTGGTAAPAAQSGDTMSKGKMSSSKMTKKKSKKSSKMMKSNEAK